MNISLGSFGTFVYKLILMERLCNVSIVISVYKSANLLLTLCLPFDRPGEGHYCLPLPPVTSSLWEQRRVGVWQIVASTFLPTTDARRISKNNWYCMWFLSLPHDHLKDPWRCNEFPVFASKTRNSLHLHRSINRWMLEDSLTHQGSEDFLYNISLRLPAYLEHFLL